MSAVPVSPGLLSAGPVSVEPRAWTVTYASESVPTGPVSGEPVSTEQNSAGPETA